MLRLLLVGGLAMWAWGRLPLSLPFATPFSGGALDGTSWEVRIKRNRLLAISHKDTLFFDQGRLVSSQHLERGFHAAPYKAERVWGAGPEAWQASMDSPAGGSLHWRGQIEGDEIRGNLTWVQPSGGSRVYTFRGWRKSGRKGFRVADYRRWRG